MNMTPAFDYAQARIQARYGERPEATVWMSLEQINDFGRYLHQVKATGLSPWVEKLGASSDAHEIETSLRQAFRSHVQEVAGWAPDHWEAAILWFGVLIDLERFHAIVNGRKLPDWIPDDVSQSTGRGVEDWRRAWRDRWPLKNGPDYNDLGLLEELLPVASHEEIPVSRVDRIFRRCSRRPPGLFSYLVLVLGDVMRLRGGLVRRLSFGRGN
ncbi:MAG: hypothetical protein HUJ31_05520 [Pseudomonadales bacterium]|nr:hypothetical protein [Pseudomonadales bacterium]